MVLACRLLELLAWRAGTLALGGTAALTWDFPYCEAFRSLPRSQRERMLLSWGNSPLETFRKVRPSPVMCASATV